MGQGKGNVGIRGEGDQPEAVLGTELGDELVDGGAGLLDLLALHRARAVEHDDEVGGEARGLGSGQTLIE